MIYVLADGKFLEMKNVVKENALECLTFLLYKTQTKNIK